jgi:hypothetical protein
MSKIIITPDLIELNRRAVKAKRNRSFIDGIEDLLDPEGIHLVVMSMLHNDVEVRTQLLLKFTGREDPVPGWLDMSIEDFNQLLEMPVPEIQG